MFRRNIDNPHSHFDNIIKSCKKWVALHSNAEKEKKKGTFQSFFNQFNHIQPIEDPDEYVNDFDIGGE